jgi:uncharacterized protein
MKFLLWLFLIGIVAMFYLQMKKNKVTGPAARRSGDPQDGQAADAAPDGGPAENAQAGPVPGSSEKMLRCAHCGVYVPSSDAVLLGDGQQSFCSDEHRLRHTS